MLLASWLLLGLYLVAARQPHSPACRRRWSPWSRARRVVCASTRGSLDSIAIALVAATLATIGVTFGRPGDAVGHGRVEPGHVGFAVDGLRSGLLTFGGAYTVIPLLQADACGPHGGLRRRSSCPASRSAACCRRRW